MSPESETVYTMTDFYDGPVAGIADFRGEPHAYQREFDEERGYLAWFRLWPVSAETLRLALEDWAIYERFERARRAGTTTFVGVTALPEDVPRRQELALVLEEKIGAPPAGGRRMEADFRAAATPRGLGMLTPLEVRWLPMNGTSE